MLKNVNNQYIRSKYWCCVLEKNIKLDNNSCELTQEFISKQLKYICRDYFGILHNMEDTRDHYHVVIIFENVISKNKLLILLSTLLKIPKEVITCTPSISLKYDLLYLTHKLDTEKYQYDNDKIFTNNTDLYYSLIDTTNNFNIDNLISICCSCKSLTDVIKIIGTDYYEKHWRLISQLFNDSKTF